MPPRLQAGITAISRAALIVGNGPSLNDVPDAFLHIWQADSFGSNHIALHPWFRPAYYANVDRNILADEHGRQIASISCKIAIEAYINADYAGKLQSEYGLKNIVPIHRWPSVYGQTKFIGDPLNPEKGFSTAAKTVSFVLMQLAYMLGYDTLLLVGFDCTYGMSKKHFYDDRLAPKYNHKSPDQDKAWQAKCDFGFQLARQFFEERKGRIINLTKASTTTRIFEKGCIEEWM